MPNAELAMTKKSSVENMRELMTLMENAAGFQEAESTERRTISWTKPNFDFEWSEIEFQSEIPDVPADVRHYLKQHYPDKVTWLSAAQQGQAVTIQPNHRFDIEHYPRNKRSLIAELKPQQDSGGPDKAARAEQAFDKGSVEMPIILNTGNRLWLIAGKTRLGFANYIFKIPAKVWMIGDSSKEPTITVEEKVAIKRYLKSGKYDE